MVDCKIVVCSSVLIMIYFLFVSQVRTRETEGVEAVIKGLILIGYSLSKQFTLDPHTLPYKTKKLCIRRPKKSMVGVVNKWVESPYEPDVWDLTRVDLRIDQRVRQTD